MKVWITKYALTQGVERIEHSDFNPLNDKTITVYALSGFYQHFRSDEWHTTECAAIAKAEQMRIAKIESLQKLIAKLEKMTFTPKDQK